MKLYIGVAVLVVGIVGAFVLLSQSAPGATGQTAAVAGATAAPNFTLATPEGTPVSLADYKGKKAVILDFWATWCPNCQRNIPQQEISYEKHKDKIEVIGINLQEDAALVKSFNEKYGVTYPVVLDPSGSASRAYGVRYTNYHVLIDKDGAIVGAIPGDISEADFARLAAL